MGVGGHKNFPHQTFGRFSVGRNFLSGSFERVFSFFGTRALTKAVSFRETKEHARDFICFLRIMASNHAADPVPVVVLDDSDIDSDREFDEIQEMVREEKSSSSSSNSSSGDSETDEEIDSFLSRLATFASVQRLAAVRRGRVDRVRNLCRIEAGLAESGRMGEEGDFPKMAAYQMAAEAAINGHVELVDLLCEHSDYSQAEKDYMACLAYLFGRMDVVAVLAQYGAVVTDANFLADCMTASDRQGIADVFQHSSQVVPSPAKLRLIKAVLTGQLNAIQQELAVYTEALMVSTESCACARNVRCSGIGNVPCYQFVITCPILVAIARGENAILQLLLTRLQGGGQAIVGDLTGGRSSFPMKLAVIRNDVTIVQTLLSQDPTLRSLSLCMYDAMASERLAILQHLFALVKPILAGQLGGNDLRNLVRTSCASTLNLAVCFRSRRVVRLFMTTFTRAEMQFTPEETWALNWEVQTCGSLAILRSFIMWSPQYVKTNVTIVRTLSESWPLGFMLLTETGAKVAGADDPMPGHATRDQFSLNLQQQCMQLIRLQVNQLQPVPNAITSLPVSRYVRRRTQFRFLRPDGRHVLPLEEKSCEAGSEMSSRSGDESSVYQDAVSTVATDDNALCFADTEMSDSSVEGSNERRRIRKKFREVESGDEEETESDEERNKPARREESGSENDSGDDEDDQPRLMCSIQSAPLAL